MEALLRRELGCGSVRATGHAGGGCVSQGRSYDTDRGRVFVKENGRAEARRMFEGEMAGLTAILDTGTVRVPRPLAVLGAPGGGCALVMEHLDMRPLSRHAAQLGGQLADLHLDNKKLGEALQKGAGTVGHGGGQAERAFVDQFGFSVVTCCGYLPQVNDWQEDWVAFYARQRIQPQIDMVEKGSGDREALELWAALQLKIPSLFRGLDIVPALLHGDLWSGNVAEDASGPVIFDPASFYGHSEYELAIAGMFGGFSGSFYSAYHARIPKAPGFEKRLQLYQLFHYLNHWNHFGSGYRGSSLNHEKPHQMSCSGSSHQMRAPAATVPAVLPRGFGFSTHPAASPDCPGLAERVTSQKGCTGPPLPCTFPGPPRRVCRVDWRPGQCF